MKKLGTFALLLSLGMFTLGCEKTDEGDTEGTGDTGDTTTETTDDTGGSDTTDAE